jgi:dipeptidyl aminopeptidase/acylaminoacyl peptidase
VHDLENRPMTRMCPRRAYLPGIAIAVAMAMLMAGCASSPEAGRTEPTSKVDAGTTASSPQPSSTVEGRFGQVGGWIAYSSGDGIWAVDPARPERRIRLSRADGDPIAWSSDGTNLLIRRESPNQVRGGIREMDLVVFDADGTETRLTNAQTFVTGGSFSPDGSEVVYATTFPRRVQRSTR